MATFNLPLPPQPTMVTKYAVVKTLNDCYGAFDTEEAAQKRLDNNFAFRENKDDYIILKLCFPPLDINELESEYVNELIEGTKVSILRIYHYLHLRIEELKFGSEHSFRYVIKTTYGEEVSHPLQLKDRNIAYSVCFALAQLKIVELGAELSD